MVDAALIQQCADPQVKPAIVEKFIERAGAPDPLAVTVRAGDRVVLVPKPASPEQALELIRQHVGRHAVRVGTTQLPAGFGGPDAAELTTDLVDPCANIRMGSALFGKVYNIVTGWYGREADEAFEGAILAWKTGYFEGSFVFQDPEPGKSMPHGLGRTLGAEPNEERGTSGNPYSAEIRIDLSGIGVQPPGPEVGDCFTSWAIDAEDARAQTMSHFLLVQEDWKKLAFELAALMVKTQPYENKVPLGGP